VVRQRHIGGCAAAQRRLVCAIRVVMSDSLSAWRWAVAPLSLTESPAHSAAGEAKPPGASAGRLCGRSVTVASSLSAALVSLSRPDASDPIALFPGLEDILSSLSRRDELEPCSAVFDPVGTLQQGVYHSWSRPFVTRTRSFLSLSQLCLLLSYRPTRGSRGLWASSC
jgi:hypothetical protein